MSIDEMLPIMQEMDKIGYYSAEVWGGKNICNFFLTKKERRDNIVATSKKPVIKKSSFT